jgi:adenylosuccinate synthase
MSVDVLLGLQWGDEGKGKVVDVLSPDYNVIARFQGGPNAGHSLEFNGIKHVLHTIPSGIFRDNCINIIGNGVVIDPIVLKKEIVKLESMGVDVRPRLFISKKAHLILPTHKHLDAASESNKGKDKIGSTLKGIGPTYMDKTGRNGLRVGDIFNEMFQARYDFLKSKHDSILSGFDYTYEIEKQEEEWFDGIEFLKTFHLVDGEHLINKLIKEGKTILAEGAQGSLLDIDFGSYPFVTSSNTITAGACTGLGVPPNKIGDVIGIIKAYSTRVGSGPFPTELLDETGERLRKIGNEFGATTGRPRRCGWIDLPALKYAIMINGVTKLVMTKADVLSGFETIRVCTHYKYMGQIIDFMPFDIVHDYVTPIYLDVKGWNQDLTGMTSEKELPKEMIDYIKFLEEHLQTPITIVSVGPDRNQTIVR